MPKLKKGAISRNKGKLQEKRRQNRQNRPKFV